MTEIMLGTAGPEYLDVVHLPLAVSASADLVAAQTGKKIRVLEYALGATGTGTVKFQSGGSTDLTGAIGMVAGSTPNANFSPVGLFETVAGEKLNVVVTGTPAAGGWLNYILI